MFAKLVGHENLVRDVAWHPKDANVVVTVGDDGKVKVFDVRKGGVCKTTFVLESKANGTKKRCIVGDGRVAAASNYTIKTWNLETYSLTSTIKITTDGGEITAIAFHPVDDMILVATENGFVYIYRKSTCEASIRAHRHPIFELSFLSIGSHF